MPDELKKTLLAKGFPTSLKDFFFFDENVEMTMLIERIKSGKTYYIYQGR